MQKYSKGTLVEVVKHNWRPDLIGERFVVGATKISDLSVGGEYKQEILRDVLIYMTPFDSVLPERAGKVVWLPEDHLRPVEDGFPEDDGFEFDESKPVWKPTVIVEDGEALVV